MALALNTWHPISEAPQDGSTILVAYKIGSIVHKTTTRWKNASWQVYGCAHGAAFVQPYAFYAFDATDPDPADFPDAPESKPV